MSRGIGREGGIVAPVRAALILIGVQDEYLHPDGCRSVGGLGGADPYQEYADYLSRVDSFATWFRARGLPVIHVGTEDSLLPSRTDTPASRSRWDRAGGPDLRGMPDELVVAPEDIVLTTAGHSAFNGTPLDSTLRELGCDRIVLGGGEIAGSLTDTAYDAAALGYRTALVTEISYSTAPSASVREAIMDVVSAEELRDGDWLERAGRTSRFVGAVVLMDSDERILRRGGIAGSMGAAIDHLGLMEETIDKVVLAAQTRGWPVLRVATVISNPAYSSFPNTREAQRDIDYFVVAGPLPPRVAAQTAVVKSGPGAFAGTALDRILRNLGVRRVVLAGGDCRDGQAVVATVRQGAELGYDIVVLGDTTYPTTIDSLGDADRRCAVIDSAQWLASLSVPESTAPPVAAISVE